MLTHFDRENILYKFPNIKLSYENITHKKVYKSDYIVAIPKGKKCFVWFTYINNKSVCLIMELAQNKQIIDIQTINAYFLNELAYGTILYGTVLYNLNNCFFFIEDIFSYKGESIQSVCWGEKLIKINDMLSKNFKTFPHNNSLIFGLPLICKNNEDLEKGIKNINYQVESVQFKLFNRINNFLYMPYKLYIEKKEIYKNKINFINTEAVFLIRPDIQDDIYYIFCLNNDFKEEQHSIAHIPNYTTSVMMNKLFRIIKENYNLDALEESDDEEEFENINIDKFVHLNKSLKVVCQFNHKFKKWVPIRLAYEHLKIISKHELKEFYKQRKEP